jgi:hypothetical protein
VLAHEGNGDAHELALETPNANLVSLSQREVMFRMLLAKSKTIRVLAVIDACLVFLYYIEAIYYLSFMVVLCGFGYYSGRQFSRVAGLLYLMVLFLSIVLRIVAAVLYESVLFQVIISL